MSEKNELINLAKGNTAKATKKTTKKKVTKKKVVKKPVVKKTTPEELRDEKAKKVVNELLEDSPILNLNKPEELIEMDETPTTEQPKGVEWLEEQIVLLTKKNEELTFNYEKAFQENQQLKSGSNTGGTNDGELKKVVIELFNELQENHIKLGVDKQGIGNFRIYCPGFLNRLIKFFPFLEEVKRY